MRRRRLYCYHCAKYTYHLITEDSMNHPQKDATFQCLRCGKRTTEAEQPPKRPRRKRETWEEKEARIAVYFAKKETEC